MVYLPSFTVSQSGQGSLGGAHGTGNDASLHGRLSYNPPRSVHIREKGRIDTDYPEVATRSPKQSCMPLKTVRWSLSRRDISSALFAREIIIA
jgi:hypothetical protein